MKTKNAKKEKNAKKKILIFKKLEKRIAD